MTSVLAAALGAQASLLRPEVAEYVAGVPSTGGAACSEGAPSPVAGSGQPRRGVGEGLFTRAGSPLRGLLALARPLVGPGLLITRWERDVPFRIVNAPTGSAALAAHRSFCFEGGEQVAEDVLVPTGRPGGLLDLLGRERRIEVALRASATEAGHLLLESTGVRVRLGRAHVPLPGLLGVSVRVEGGFDDELGRHTIAARIANPLVGTVLAYTGWFEYRYED
ncbi:DUF4166 domain-containing protein [Brevibacterium sp. 5221]|uniref:DUF4166 domain-containing protein n=1 Tax=Brevibacterium rongguiense TaxID=2695267 RepID=A0A6N9HB61_9MICO|nr:DUF4166 domain-containing protein [Brevibacterium rongguiense]MYM20724.1 DUF4166 domain-containing protein [Brevibacterium rongguiense]